MKQPLLAAMQRTGRFLRWWISELGACAQDAISLIAPKWRRALTIYVSTDRLAVIDAGSADRAPILEIPLPRPGLPFPDALPDPVPTELQRGRRVRIAMAAQYAFSRRLCLPLAALPYLKTAVSLQIPKLLPMSVSHLLTDFEIAATDAVKGVVTIDLCALKRSDVEPIAQAIQAWGLRIAALQIAEGLTATPRFRFVGLGGSGQAAAMRRTDRWLIGAAAAFGFGCAALAATQSFRAQQSLDRALDRTGNAASVALLQRQSLLARLEPLKALSQIENEPPAVAILAEITSLVPPDSWVTTFELKRRNLRLVGISPDPADVVKRLTSSALMTDVELRSSMSAGIGTGKDRFEITALAKSVPP